MICIDWVISRNSSSNNFLNAVIGGYYTYPEAISTENSTFSADIYLSEQGSTSMSLVFALVDLEEEKYCTYINFAYGGVADVLVKGILLDY